MSFAVNLLGDDSTIIDSKEEKGGNRHKRGMIGLANFQKSSPFLFKS